ncbi:MAG: FUSC family protein, partial [Geminicoccaceae bacterium]
MIALKTCVGLVIGVSIALWLGWSATGVGFACIMLQTAYLGRTLGRSILRMAGALAGALLAMAFIATLIQERAALIGAYALLTGLIIYLEQVSEHPYALLFVLLSVGLITFNSIDDPQNAFSVAVSWVSGNALGVTIVLFMHGVLWPHTGEKSFEQQLKTFMQGLARLFALKMTALPQEARQQDARSRDATTAEIHQLESRLVAALVQLRLALGIASRDTDRFIRFEAAYADLMEQLQSLTSVIMAYGDSLRVWRDTPLADAVIPHSPVPHALMSTLEEQLDDLVTGCDRPRDGTDQPQGPDGPHTIATQIEAIRQSVGAHDHSVLEVALFDAVSEKALETSQAVAGVRQALATVEQPGRHVAHVPGAQVDVITRIQSRGLRLQKAAIGVVAVIAASLLWIYLQWPDPGSLMVMVLLPVALNAMVPTFPIKAGLKSLFWGPAIGALLYFVIMPPLSDMWQLAPLVVLCLFPTAYLTNSPNPSTMIFGLMTSLWAFLLADVSQGQVYSFAQFSNNALGIIGGVGVALAALAFFNPPVPERQFKTYARAFLQRCESAIDDLRERTTQP